MSDEPVTQQPNHEDDEPSASAIFVELMRQAAAKAAPKSRASAPERLAGQQALPEGAEPSLAPLDETHQIRRVRRRLALRRPHPSSMAGGFLGTIFVVVVSTALVATLLMFFVNPEFLNPAVVKGLQLDRDEIIAGIEAPRPTPVRTPQWLRRIGIISGHRGLGTNLNRDPGAVCYDAYQQPYLEEETINFAVSRRVVANLEALNFTVDMLDEFDPRLDDYRADALLSIHANSCIDFGEVVSGYIVSKSDARPDVGADVLLRECIALNYGAHIPLERSYNETEDMINNHAWRKIHPLTPGVILEMGFMLADQEILTTQHDLLAHAITMGILCYIENAGLSFGLPQAGERSADYLLPILATPTPIFGR
ncbi:MAG: N-acetylmuramoyl-L-alanine amidase [Chloroflexota bacterium]|nr:N-acetylmuramoyl-L-alanine amidase [Chloroflexota bacterium]MDE2946546.1 N-acetylmuramoyl-L-alanine amidase [Chloroflexota bacterium]